MNKQEEHFIDVPEVKKWIEDTNKEWVETHKPVYYDGTKLLSMKDIDGNTPEIFMCTTNRTGGKTTYFNRLEINRFLRNGSKFALLYRYNYELEGVEEKFFKDIQGLFFSNYHMTSESMCKGKIKRLYFGTDPNDMQFMKECGYAICLNDADAIKKNSHFFSDVDSILFDEFQSETNKYCTDELTKFQSIHTSIARGQGKQRRYVPVYMLSNQVSLINPYYTAFGISSRLNNDTKFLKGHGFVLEQGFIETASRAQQESGVFKAFAGSNYNKYSSQNCYLNDNFAFIEEPKGRGKYICTLKYNGTEYGVIQYTNDGIIYCSNRADSTFPIKFAVTTEDHNINYVLLKTYNALFMQLRFYFERGCFRFSDLKSKEALMCAISY